MTAKKHILVVEDEEHLAIGIRYNLQAENYRVTTVEDGPSALKVIADHPHEVDLVILDLMLPGMSGYDVCESLRNDGQDMPVLILSARTLAEDRTRGFDVGGDQYLTKPFELDELLSRVDNLLSRGHRAGVSKKQAEPSGLFRIGEAQVNLDTFDVNVSERNTQLTQLEMKLLKYFISNEGRVVSRQELLENVWGMSGNITTRAPDQFIRRLRKIFEPDPSVPTSFPHDSRRWIQVPVATGSGVSRERRAD